MARPRPRRLLLVVAAVLAVAYALAGGSATAPLGGGQQETTVPPPREFPEPPETLTNQTARDVALEHEVAYVHNRLRAEGYPYWEVPGWRSPNATVLNRSNGSAYVHVEMPYTYARDDAVADASVKAVYVVSTSTIERVNGTGLHRL